MGASVIAGTSKKRGNGNEDPSGGNSSNEGHSQWMKTTRPWLSGADQAGEHVAKPALSGRKAHRKTCTEDKQGRREERNQERDEERHFRGKDRGQEMPRWMETLCADQVQDGSRGGTSESFSSNSDMQLNSILEGEEPSNHSKSQHKSSRSKSIKSTQTTTTNFNSPSGQPFAHSRFTHPSSQVPFPRDSDPLWTERRIEAGSGRSSQNHQTNNSESEYEEEEAKNKDNIEEGSGVVEVMGQPMNSTESPLCVPSGERRMRKREKGRIESLRRRQRRRERWRLSQQHESTQVNPSVVIVIKPLLSNVITVSSFILCSKRFK